MFTAQRLYHKHLRDQLVALDTKEANLIALAEDGELPQARIKTRLTEITREREKLQAEQGRVQQDLSAAAAFLSACLELLRNPYEMYRGASDKVRRRLNQAVFKRIYVFNDEIVGHELQSTLAGLQAIQTGVEAIRRGEAPEKAGMLARAALRRHVPETELATRRGGEWLDLIEALTCGFSFAEGVNKEHMVGRMRHYSKDAVQGRHLRHLVDVVTVLMKQQVTALRPLPYVHKLSQRPSMDTLGPALAEAYRDGASVRVLRQQFRLSQGSVLKLLAEHGVETRQQGLSEEQMPTVIALYQEEHTIVQVAQRFGVAPQTVRKALVDHGIGIRAGGRRGRKRT